MDSLDVRIFSLKLRVPFTTARETKSYVGNVFVSIDYNDRIFWGEAAPNMRYQQNMITTASFLQKQIVPKDKFSYVEEIESYVNWVRNKTTVKNHAACSALEMLLLDICAYQREKPMFDLLGASSHIGPVSSYTIGITTIDKIENHINSANHCPILKIKLGTSYDHEIIMQIRKFTDKPLWIDVNEGWKDITKAKKMIDFLADKHILAIEQPMSVENNDKMVQLKRHSPIPLFADESFVGGEPLEQIAEWFDGINIKLMKTGGLLASISVIRHARKIGLQCMVGCMIESTLADTSSAVASLWADYADIDGRLLIVNDPFSGGVAVNGKGQLFFSKKNYGFGVDKKI